MYDAATKAFHVQRLDWDRQVWVDTGVVVDQRQASQADVVSDGDTVWIVSAGTEPYPSDAARLVRLHYDPGTSLYQVDPGFPVQVTQAGTTEIVIAHDGAGKLWITYIQDGELWINRSATSDTDWGSPFQVRDPEGDAAAARATIIAAGGAVHVLWSDHTEDAVFLASHQDGAPDQQWSGSRTIVAGVRSADDHLNVKAAMVGGQLRLYVAVKTSLDTEPNPNPHDPQILVLEILPDGTVRRHLAGRVMDRHTRPIILIDQDDNEIYVVATSPFAGGQIFYKRSSLDNIAFPPGKGTVLMHSSSDQLINDATSTKQNLTVASGLVVLASDMSTGRYLHAVLDLGGPYWHAPERRGAAPGAASPSPGPADTSAPSTVPAPASPTPAAASPTPTPGSS
jgi:hypothetical protein